MYAELTHKLTTVALKRVRSFNLVVGAAATVGLAGTMFASEAGATRLLFAVALLAIAMVMFLLQFAVRYTQNSKRFAERFAGIVGFVFSSVALTFAALLVILVVYVCQLVFTTHVSAEVARIDGDADLIFDLRGVYESSLYIGAREPGLPNVATRAAQLAEDLEQVPAKSLSWKYDIWRQRWIGYGYLLACSAGLILEDRSAVGKCVRGLSAIENARSMIASRRLRRDAEELARDDISWIEESHIESRILRDYASMSFLMYEQTGDRAHAYKACRALEDIDLGWRHEDPPRTSPILLNYLAPGTDVCLETVAPKQTSTEPSRTVDAERTAATAVNEPWSLAWTGTPLSMSLDGR